MRPLSEFRTWSRATPLQFSERLSEATGATVYLKREDLQVVRSYKLRGAYNLLRQLSQEEIAAGVVCSSAGNHAQGFAMACRSMGIHGRVYVPAKTPKQKRDRIRYHGARVHRADRRRQDLRRGRGGRAATMSRAPAPRWCRRTTTRARSPGRAPSPSNSSTSSTTSRTWSIVPVGGGGCISGITTYLRRADEPRRRSSASSRRVPPR